MIKKNILESIGNTNLIYLERISKAYNNEIYMKDESTNPFGSIKDRASKLMIERAMTDGIINKETVIVEATSGNTGIGLAGVCCYYGLKLIIVMPNNASIERIKIMKAYNAEVILTPAELGMEGSIEKANEIMNKNKNSYMPSQFTNENNYLAHYYTTAKEIDDDLDVNIIFCGIGTSGTITGIGKYFKEKNKYIEIIGIEPFESAVINGNPKGSHGIEGIGAGFIPDLYNDEYIDKVIKNVNKIKSNKYYVQMAIAWLLAESYIKQKEKTTEYLKNNELDNFTHNKAIQKIIDSYRVSEQEKEFVRTLKRKAKKYKKGRKRQVLIRMIKADNRSQQLIICFLFILNISNRWILDSL